MNGIWVESQDDPRISKNIILTTRLQKDKVSGEVRFYAGGDYQNSMLVATYYNTEQAEMVWKKFKNIVNTSKSQKEIFTFPEDIRGV